MPKTYRIGEAAKLLNLKTYVLRFWETEFPQLVPLRTDTGQRLYTEEHIRLLEHIRTLLHEQGLTIEGARRKLEEEQGACPPAMTLAGDDASAQLLDEVVQELEAIRDILAAEPPSRD
jgi:DNA-binding transcriptional MerR regulator